MSKELTRFEDRSNLPEQVRTYVRESVSDNTRRAYRADLNHFEVWGGTIPATPEMIAAYLSAHADVLAIATLKRRLASLSVAHEAKGHPNPVPTKLVQSYYAGHPADSWHATATGQTSDGRGPDPHRGNARRRPKGPT